MRKIKFGVRFNENILEELEGAGIEFKKYYVLDGVKYRKLPNWAHTDIIASQFYMVWVGKGQIVVFPNIVDAPVYYFYSVNEDDVDFLIQVIEDTEMWRGKYSIDGHKVIIRYASKYSEDYQYVEEGELLIF